MKSLTANKFSNLTNSTPDESIGQTVKNIRRKHGPRAIRFGREAIRDAIAVSRKDWQPGDDCPLVFYTDDEATQG